MKLGYFFFFSHFHFGHMAILIQWKTGQPEAADPVPCFLLELYSSCRQRCHTSFHSGDNSAIAAQSLRRNRERRSGGKTKQNKVWPIVDCFHPLKQWFLTLAADYSSPGRFKKHGNLGAQVRPSDILR